jgi:hypothetical protein
MGHHFLLLSVRDADRQEDLKVERESVCPLQERPKSVNDSAACSPAGIPISAKRRCQAVRNASRSTVWRAWAKRAATLPRTSA